MYRAQVLTFILQAVERHLLNRVSHDARMTGFAEAVAVLLADQTVGSASKQPRLRGFNGHQVAEAWIASFVASHCTHEIEGAAAHAALAAAADSLSSHAMMLMSARCAPLCLAKDADVDRYASCTK